MTAARLPLPAHLTPADALLRLRAAGLSGIFLLESLGPLTPFSRFSFLSAVPGEHSGDLPDPPAGRGFFPAWLGGLRYEGAAAFGLPTHPGAGGAWGLYPSGVVWDRERGEVWVEGERHLDWAALFAHPPAPAPVLKVGELRGEEAPFAEGVRAVQELIRAGEVYQVNLSRGVGAPYSGDPLAAYLALREQNPSPFMAYAELGGAVVVSCSPERLALLDGGRVSARPIAGTRPRGGDPAEDAALEAELRGSEKEVSEHIMLLDLIRHDLGHVAAPGSVHVPELLVTERYSHVMHLVSEVQAQAAPGVTPRDLLAATFPGGTITGAPKRRVMAAIRDLESSPRSFYTGSLGIVSPGADGRGRADFNILIRTAEFAGGRVTVRAGAGVVIDSDPEAETRETLHKAAALLAVLGGEARAGQPPAPPVGGGAWRPAKATGVGAPLRVLVLDNFDSFSQNLRHDLLALGARPVWRDHTTPLAELLALRPDAVMVGPGPGTPDTSGVTLPLTHTCLERRIPLLGVCLGHQALGQALGGRVERADPRHGRVERLRHGGAGLFAGLPDPATFGRYHSLVVRDLPAGGVVDAHAADGEIMALHARAAPAWGVQFHPESVMSAHGRALLANWLRLAARWNEAEGNP